MSYSEYLLELDYLQRLAAFYKYIEHEELAEVQAKIESLKDNYREVAYELGGEA